jgi:hypothetical protein
LRGFTAVCVFSACLVSAQVLFAYDLTLVDPTGDDYGPGTYMYPLDQVFTPGSFDITRFSAEEIGNKVRFEIEIQGELDDPWGSGAGFSLQSVDIYVDQDGIEGSGATWSLERRNVDFSPASAWEYVVWCAPPFDGFDPHVVDSEGTEYYAGVSVSVDQGTDVITIDVPKSVLGSPDAGWRYTVLMLGQNGYELGRVRPVMEDANQWVLGGGDDGQFDSNVIDLVAGAGVDQEALLANFDPGTGVRPVLINRVDAAPPVITHAPPASWEAHIPLEVEAEIQDDVVTNASVFFRRPGEAFTEVPMARQPGGTWAGTVPGAEIEEGALQYYVYATDATNPATLPDSTAPFEITVTADITPPSIERLLASPPVFSPNGDGNKDSTEIEVGLTEPCLVWLNVRNAAGGHVRTLAESVYRETALVTWWDGRDDSREMAPDGFYRVVADYVDLAGNPGSPDSVQVEIDMDQPFRQLDAIFLFHANQNLVPYGKAANTACYKGVLNVLRAHPTLKFVIHFSGSLLSDLLWEDPEVIDILREGAQEGQFEIAGSTYIQNIIYSTRSYPDDFQFNQHQIATHRDLIESVLGVEPVSFWNPERVWTQNIVKLLADNAYEIVQVEDHILYDSGITGSEYAVRTTSYGGDSVYVFDDDKAFEGAVNGAIDSGDTASVMWFLRNLYDEDVDDRYAVCYHEDMEATGLWDYEGGENPAVDFANLDNLLTALENDPTIKVTTYSEFLLDHEPLEDVTPIVDGAAAWMGEDAWFVENSEPQAEAYRLFFDGIRDTLNAVHLEFAAHAPDTVAARRLFDHGWFTLIAHQYEFAVHGYGGIVGTTQWELARTALVSAIAAREALFPQSRSAVKDVNGDGIEEIVMITSGDFYVLSRYGGRLLYWFDLEAGVELVGNENFMRSYGESYADDNAYVPVAVGSEAYPWLSGNMIIPEIQEYRFEARRRCFNDSVFIGGVSAGPLVDSPLAYEIGAGFVRFTYNLGDLTILKTYTPALHTMNVEYGFQSWSAQALDIELVLENGLSPDCLTVMMAGRASLKYWDGSDTSSVFAQSMPGVVNVASGKGLLFDFGDPPAAISSDVDVFGLEVNPRWSFEIPAGGAASVSLALAQQALAGVDGRPGLPVEGRLRIMPNPSVGKVDLVVPARLGDDMTAGVFDTAGRLVRTLSGPAPGSARILTWDGRNDAGVPVAGGIYFIRISSAGESATGKVTLLR